MEQSKKNMATLNQVQRRVKKLGFDTKIRIHDLLSPVGALLCFPMHYVVFSEKTNEENSQSIIEDLFEIKGVVDSFVVQSEVSKLPVSKAEREVLRALLRSRRPIDNIIYDFSIKTIELYFEIANSDVIELSKAVIARTIAAVALASGEGWFGTGSSVSPAQKKTIQLINDRLGLSKSPTAAIALQELEL